MAAYTDEALSEKLQRLLPTQQSIQTLSHWIIYHRKRYHKQSVQAWERELWKAPPEKRITFLYLANDVMQTSRAKGFEFLQEFSKILAPIVSKVFTEGDAETQKQIERLLAVWQERRVLQQGLIDQMRAGFSKSGRAPNAAPASPHDDLAHQLAALGERNKRVEDLAEAAKGIKPELRSGDTLKNAQPEAYNTAHTATREALHTLENYVKALEDDLQARDSLLQALRTSTTELEKSTAERKQQLQHAQAELAPAVTSLKNALLQPPPVGLPVIEAPAPQHEAYMPAPAAGGNGQPSVGGALSPELLAVLAQLGAQPPAPPAAGAEPKQMTGWLPLQQ